MHHILMALSMFGLWNGGPSGGEEPPPVEYDPLEPIESADEIDILRRRRARMPRSTGGR